MAYTNVLKPGIYAIRNVLLTNGCMHEDSSTDVFGINCTQFGLPDVWQVASGSTGWTIQQNSTKDFMAFSFANTDGSPLILVEPRPFTWKIEPSSTFGMKISSSSANLNGCVAFPSDNNSESSKGNPIILTTCVETGFQNWVFQNIQDFVNTI